MNDENLKKGKATQFKSGDEAARNGRKGGIASGKARREKADMRKLLTMMLEENIPTKKGSEEITYAQRITKSIMTIASDPRQGSAAVRAYETILHTIGQDEPEPRQDSLDTLRQILEVNKQNANRVQSDEETT